MEQIVTGGRLRSPSTSSNPAFLNNEQLGEVLQRLENMRVQPGLWEYKQE